MYTYIKQSVKPKNWLAYMLSLCILLTLSAGSSAGNVSFQGDEPSTDDFINAFMGTGSQANDNKPAKKTIKYRGISLKKSTPKPQLGEKTIPQEQKSFEQKLSADKMANTCLASKQSVTVNINFAPKSSDVTDTALINNIAKAMNSNQLSQCYFVIEGHTDAMGDDYYNLWLSQQRASEVKTYLSQYNVENDRLIVVGKGEDELLNTANPGARENRRVTFKVINYK